MYRFFAVSACIVSLSAAACSSSNGGPQDSGEVADAGNDGCVAYVSTANLTTPVVSFGVDVLPILQSTCATEGVTCHGTPDVTALQRPYLGDSDGGTDAQAVLSGIVNVDSSEAPSMLLVAPGSPTDSFLMHKLDWDQCTLVAKCADTKTEYTTCGEGMPYSENELDTTTRDTLRRWIAQGAKNN